MKRDLAFAAWCVAVLGTYAFYAWHPEFPALPFPEDPQQAGHAYLWTCAEGFLVAAWTALLSFHVGDALLRQLTPRDSFTRLERVVFASALGIGLMSFIVLVLGAMQLWRPAVFWIAGLALSLFFAVRAMRHHEHFFEISVTWPLSRTEGAGLVVLAIFFLFFFFAELTPEIFYDSLHYHLAVPNLYRIAHGIYPMPNLLLSNFVQLPQFYYGWALTLGNALSAKLLHGFTALLLACAFLSFGRRFLSPGSGLLAALIFFSTPLVGMNLMTAGIDVACAFFCFTGIYALWVTFKENPEPGGLILAGMLFGLTAGCKAPLLPVPFIALGIFLWKRRGAGASAHSARRESGYFLLGLSLAVSPWLLRNWIWHRNPFYPFGAAAGWGSPALDPALWKIFRANAGGSWVEIFGSIRSFFRFLLHPWFLTMEGRVNSDFIGPLYLLLMPVLIFDKQRRAVGAASFLAFFAAGLWISWVGTQMSLRFFIPGLAILAVVLAEAVLRLRSGRFKRFLLGMAAVGIAANGCAGLRRFWIKDGWKVVLCRVSEDAYLKAAHISYRSPPYAAIRWMNDRLPPGSNILFMGEARTFPTRHLAIGSSHLDRQFIVDWARQSSDGDALARRMRNEGVTHLFLNYSNVVQLGGRALFQWDSDSWAVFDDFWKKYVQGMALYAPPSQNLVLMVFNILPAPRPIGLRRQAPANPFADFVHPGAAERRS